jgi:hypothetical protein
VETPEKTVLKYLLISNFRPVLNVVCFLLGDYPASEFYMPMFWNTLFHLQGGVAGRIPGMRLLGYLPFPL